jgi:uncharacterized protein YndB with AHSA1/START domain
MAVRSNAAINDSPEPTLVITRVFDAPRVLVFNAWLEPELIVKWFGPKGFSSSVISMDARPGGSYRFHMRGPDGDHWVQGVYREIVEPERIVCTFVWTDGAGSPTRPETLLILTFEEHGEKTNLTLHQTLFESATARDEHENGWTSSLERLTEYLANRRHPDATE